MIIKNIGLDLLTVVAAGLLYYPCLIATYSKAAISSLVTSNV